MLDLIYLPYYSASTIESMILYFCVSISPLSVIPSWGTVGSVMNWICMNGAFSFAPSLVRTISCGLVSLLTTCSAGFVAIRPASSSGRSARISPLLTATKPPWIFFRCLIAVSMSFGLVPATTMLWWQCAVVEA